MSSEYICFLDESGDQSLTSIDKDFPVFVLCLVVIKRSDYVETVIPQITALKLKHWNHEGINFHSSDIRKEKGDFAFLQTDPNLRAAFLGDISALMQDLPYTFFVAGIRKEQHLKRYGDAAQCPYELSLTFILERLLHFAKENSVTSLPIIAERRGKNEDSSLERFFYKLLATGSHYHPAYEFQQMNATIEFRKKIANIAGIQIADLVAHPCARQIIKGSQGNRAFKIVIGHRYKSGSVTGWKTFP